MMYCLAQIHSDRSCRFSTLHNPSGMVKQYHIMRVKIFLPLRIKMSLTWGTLQSEDGEGTHGRNTLSVTFGDSSPKGRAKGLY